MHLLIAVLILGLIWFGIKQMAAGSRKDLTTNLRKIVGVTAIALSFILTLRGGLIIAVPTFFAGLGLLGVGHLAGIDLPWSKKFAGGKSQLRTAMLLMELDRKNGSIEGGVLRGAFKGRQLNGLSLGELHQVLGECAAAGDQSPQLMQAFLDTHHPEWRSNYKGDANKTTADSGGPMNRKEALAILGLKEGASKRKIVSAHRALMKKYHPDQGGSDYLATKINEAKDILVE